jgi:CubicO group peptidase (beta-lactamase class C family)
MIDANNIRTTTLLVLVSFSFVRSFAQSPTYKPDSFTDSARLVKMSAAFPAIQNMFEAYAKDNHIPGLAFGIVAGGELIYSDGIGLSETLTKHEVTEASVFRIASMTKSFTAMAILKLRDAGKLNLDDPVIKYVPELNNTTLPTADAKPITIRNLLTHTAGFPEDNPWADRQLDMTDAELLAFVSKGISMAYVPGQNFEYSNLGYALLGQIIKRVSKQSYENYVTANILVPLNMNHTYWEYSKVPSNELVHGYRLVNGTWNEEELLHSGAFSSTGGILTSVEDFSKYMILHLSAWPAGNQKGNGPVSKGTIREMHTQGNITRLRRQTDASKSICPIITSYNNGLSWSRNCSGKTTIHHSGGLPGFGSNWAFMPEYDIAVVSLTNLTYAAPDLLNGRVLDTLISIAGLEPRIVHTSAMLKQRQQQLLKVLPDWNNATVSGAFSGNFFEDYFIDDLKAESQALYRKIGRIISIGEVIPVNQLRGYFSLAGESGKLDIWFTLSPENPALIQEYKISERFE